jgi:hypothetical protein
MLMRMHGGAGRDGREAGKSDSRLGSAGEQACSPSTTQPSEPSITGDPREYVTDRSPTQGFAGQMRPSSRGRSEEKYGL